MRTDEQLRADLHRLAPRVEYEGVWEAMHTKSTLRRRWVRAGKLVASLTCLALLALLGVQVYRALQPEPTIVITDDDVPAIGITSSLLAPQSPAEVVLFEAQWGSEPGEVGLSADRKIGPSSFFVTDDGTIYILDPVNKRILVVSADGIVQRAIATPAVTDAYDVAVAADGNIVIYDPGTASFQLYSAQGVLLQQMAYAGSVYPGRLVRAGEVVYAEMGWDTPETGFGYAVLYRSFGDAAGHLLDVSAREQLLDPPFYPLVDASGRHYGFHTPVKNSWQLYEGSQEVVRTEQPWCEAAGPLYPGVIASRLIVACDSLVDPDDVAAGIRHTVVVVEDTGQAQRFDLTTEERRVGYVHVEARVTSAGDVYFMNTDDTGLTIWKASVAEAMIDLSEMQVSRQQAWLDALVARLESKGLPVLKADTVTPDAGMNETARNATVSRGLDPEDVLPVACVFVAKSDLETPDDVRLPLNIEHEALYLISQGLPLVCLAIFSVDEQGVEKESSMGLLAGRTVDSEWGQAPLLAYAETRSVVQSEVEAVCLALGATLRSVDSRDEDDGRHVAIHALLPVETSVGVLFDGLQNALWRLNQDRGTRISVLEVSIDNPSEKALLRGMRDYAFGSQSCWLEPSLRANEQARPDFMK